MWCWRRLLRVPWTARGSNQSTLKEIRPEYSLEGLILKLKLQFFGHLMQRTDSWKRSWCWERMKAGGEGDNRGWEVWMVSPTRQTWVWASSRSWWWTGGHGMLCSQWGLKELDTTEELNWTEDILLFYRNRQTNSIILRCCGSWSDKTFLLLVTNWKII